MKRKEGTEEGEKRRGGRKGGMGRKKGTGEE